MRIITLCLLILSAAGSAAQNSGPDRSSSSRYIVLQSSITARLTMKLDTRTGDTHLLLLATDSSFVWEKVPRLSHPDYPNENKEQGIYSVFMSTTLVRNVILLNKTSGASWMLTPMKDGSYLWEPIREQR